MFIVEHLIKVRVAGFAPLKPNGLSPRLEKMIAKAIGGYHPYMTHCGGEFWLLSRTDRPFAADELTRVSGLLAAHAAEPLT